MTDTLSGFPRRLKALMAAEGLTTHTLGAKAGVSHSAIAQWLNGTNRASTEKVKPVADALGWDVYELLHERPAADIVDRLADLDAELRTVRRLVASILPELTGIAGDNVGDSAPMRPTKPSASSAASGAGGARKTS